MRPIKFMGTLVGFFLCCTAAYAETSNPALMRSGHVLSNTHTLEAWTLLDVFDKSFDVINYAKKLGNSAKPSRMSQASIGVNIPMSEQWAIRSSLAYGKQTVVRQLAPKSVQSTFHTETLLLQWHHDGFPLVIEGGYRQQTYPPSGFNAYQTGNVTVTAAAGKDLLTATSKAKSWLVSATYPIHFSDDFSGYLGVEYQRSSIQSSYTSYDPFVQSRIGGQAPQKTPWNEAQYTVLLSMDYKLSQNIGLGLDLKQINIKRSHYIPRQGFRDYNSTQIADLWLFYHINKATSIVFRGHANTHYLLGESPAAYNRRINHKFKYPFGYLTAGLAWAF